MSAIPRDIATESYNGTTASNARPRICFIGMTNLPVLAREFNRHPIGGEQVQQTLLAKAFARRGYPVSMITADYGQAEGASWDSVRTHKAFAPRDGLPVLRFFHPRWSGLWAAMKRSKADVFYTSCGGAIVGQIAMYCARHGHRMVFRVASDADCEPELPLIKYWRDKKLYEYGLRRADCVLVQSERQRELLKRNFGVDSIVAGMLVESGIELHDFDDRKFSAIWINNFRRLKRADRLLDAAQSLAHLDFHLVGGAAPGFQEYFDEICARARKQPNVSVHGQVPYHDVNEFYERARVYVSTSEIEGFPNSYLQAWVRGTPVVAYFDPDGLIAREGLGVAVSNQAELIGAIRTLTTDVKSWREASQRCRDFMRRRFSEDQVIEPYVDAFSPIR